MPKIATAMRALTRRIIAALVTLLFVFVPAAPILQAALQPPDSCPCCKRMGKKCTCHMHHFVPVDGPAFDAGQDCCRNCTQAPGVMPMGAHLGAETPSVIPLYPAVSEPLVFPGAPRAFSSIPLWLYQRPPPRRNLESKLWFPRTW